ncbi:ATP-grasp domain-containing protein [Fulvimarina endophytica]|uniref:ATP-grasp domain-containing protein n=1 Tax=Fulvimarina endophytica TaxID=2293836 RepID=A0A371X1A4_9HYPH|nr:ATP-grasp domain-containing protein [Fulvimarina endophytica]RFC63020.1 ATP-grasp domain-containing protein [Fulvimarina endophytica]
MDGADASSARPTILCAAFSARQIAESARLSGFDALAVDFFADLDLRASARRSELVTGAYPDGFSDTDLIAALERVSEGETPIGFVYGAGFEDRPELLDEIARRWPVLGTSAEASRRLKDPFWFARICERAGVAFPQIAPAAPSDDDLWLIKRVGGCGGSHVRWANRVRAAGGSGDRFYAQRFVEGERWSLLALAADGMTRSLGFSHQWTDPSEDEPFRYAGAVGPLDPPPPIVKSMVDALGRLVAAAHDDGTTLTGLLSADFVEANGLVHCLEINARFGATVDVFDRPEAPLLKLHLDACEGRLPQTLAPYPAGCRAAGLAWADVDLDFGTDHVWPHWTRDRSHLPRHYEAAEPIATVVAEGRTAKEARERFEAHVESLKASSISNNAVGTANRVPSPAMP